MTKDAKRLSNHGFAVSLAVQTDLRSVSREWFAPRANPTK